MVAGKQKMIAVINHHVEHRVMIGSAAAARRAGGLVHDDGDAARHKAHSGGKPGEPRPNDVNRARHQKNAWRMMIHNSRARGSRSTINGKTYRVNHSSAI